MYDTIREITVSAEDVGERADVCLARLTDLSRSKIKKLMDAGCIVFEDGTTVKPSYVVENDDVIEVTIPGEREVRFEPEDIPLDIRYQDDHIMVVCKPPGMVVHPGRGNIRGTLAAGLLHHCKTLSRVHGDQRPGIVHRLDKGTSGLLVVALSDRIHHILSDMIQDRRITREYTAFVWGHPEPPASVIEAPVGRHPKNHVMCAVVEGGRHAVTHYRTTASYPFLTCLAVTLETGRTHQIRVHLAWRNHHVFGDHDYGGREERFGGFAPEIRYDARKLLSLIDRQALHAGRLAFPHPETGEPMEFIAPLPDDMQRLESSLSE